MTVYKIARFIVNFVVRLFTKITIVNFENLPTSGAYIVAANHLGRLDPALVFVIIQREDVILFVAEKYRKHRLYNWFAQSLNGIYIDRFSADFNALRTALRRLQNGEAMFLAPEGTRSPTMALQAGRAGASYLAAKAQVPVVPVAITGTEDARVKAQLKRFRRLEITVQVGKPFMVPPLSNKDREETLERYTEEIMCQIAVLLPAAYRGVYASHPRLIELEGGEKKTSGVLTTSEV